MALDDDIKCGVVLKRALHELKDHRVMETKTTADKFPAVMRSSLLGTCQQQTAVYLASPVSQLLWKLVLWVRSRSHRILGPQYPWSVVGLFITIRGVGTQEKDKANFGSHPGRKAKAKGKHKGKEQGNKRTDVMERAFLHKGKEKGKEGQGRMSIVRGYSP